MSTTRRTALAMTGASLAAALTVFAAHAAPAKAKAAPMPSPAMQAAQQALADARAELDAAQEARDWLAAEWRHLWPLAPEPLLMGANAHRSGIPGEGERDILGEHLMRDTADLTKRFTRQQRESTPRTCFHLDTSDRIADRLAYHTARVPEGRTDKARARNAMLRERAIADLSERLPLARAYEAETARIREASGVDAVLARVADAKRAYDAAGIRLVKTPATSLADLAVKADMLVRSISEIGFNVDGPNLHPLFSGGAMLSRDILAMMEG